MYMYDLSNIYVEAYPVTPPEMRDSMVRDVFVLGLSQIHMHTEKVVRAANITCAADVMQQCSKSGSGDGSSRS